MSESIKLILKPKSIPVFVDFCIEEKIEFNVKPQDFPDTDWEFSLVIKDIKSGVITGMFLRENRIEIPGSDNQKSKKPAVKKTREEEEKTSVAPVVNETPTTPESEDKGLF
jgi:hypothetical protein